MNYAITNFDTANIGWRSASGESEAENEDSVEYESEASDPSLQDADPLDESEMPKFRHLVRAKKLEMKAQYGKAHFQTSTGTKQVCVNVPYTKWDPNINCVKIGKKTKCLGGFIGGTRRECKDIKYPVITWVWGWRKKWREFKKQGGLAQLKRQSQGLDPIPGTAIPYVQESEKLPINTPIVDSGTKTDPKLDLPKVKQAGMGTNIILSLLVIGLAIGATKIIK